MERHSVRGARADQPSERRRPEARRSESALFRTGCHGATHRCRPFTAKTHALNSKRRCTATRPPALHPLPTHRRPFAPLSRTNTPACTFFHSRRAMAPSARREKQGGSSRKQGGFREKAGNFFETNGDFASLSSLMTHLSPNKIDKTTSYHSNITVGVLIRGGYKKLVSFLFGQQGRDVYFCGVLQQYYTKTLHTMTI
mgnify:CR=1 FL=1